MPNPQAKLTDKKCSKCGVLKPLSDFHKDKYSKDGLKQWCKGCVKEYSYKNIDRISDKNKAYYIKNKASILERRKEYRGEYKEEIKKYQKHHYQKNKQTILERQKKYNLANKEKQKKYRGSRKDIQKKNNARYYLEHKDDMDRQAKKYRNTVQGRDAINKASQKRRALKSTAECEDFSPSYIFERDNYICQNCGKKTRPDFKSQHHPLYPNLDHIVPLSRGGTHTRLNTQCLCHQCNAKKHNNNHNDQLRMFG